MFPYLRVDWADLWLKKGVTISQVCAADERAKEVRDIIAQNRTALKLLDGPLLAMRVRW